MDARRTLIATVVVVVGMTTAPCRAENYVIDQTSTTDTVYFRSSAKLEFIEGETHAIVGVIDMGTDSTLAEVTGLFQVDLRTLKSDIDLRDEHMRERHLETDKYPHAYFSVTSIQNCPRPLKADTTYDLSAGGRFYIHGVWREIAVRAAVSRAVRPDGAEEMVVRAKFSIKLDDFGIPRPKALFLKLAEVVNVEVIFTADNNLPAPAISLPQWSERK